MKNKLFMGGLAWGTTEASLRAACEKYGEVEDVRIITDQATGRSKGFGFVTFATEEAATKAKGEMDGMMLDGRAVKVDWPREREDRGPRGGGGFGGGRDRNRF
jgi:RNA recognition motif-containing protein